MTRLLQVLAGVLSLLFFADLALAKPVAIHVSPKGNDAWNGLSTEAAGPNGPKATLPSALAAARLQRENGYAEAIQILLHDGRYVLSEPIVLGPADSGLNERASLSIEAFNSEKPVLTYSRPLSGWKQMPNSPLWSASLPASNGERFRELFVNGERRQRARTPNQGFFRIQGGSPQDKPVQIHFKEGDIREGWAASGDVELIALLAWADIRMAIRKIDPLNKVATLSGNPRPSNQEANARYYIENAPDGLDSPGEWYWDRAKSEMRYWPKPGEKLEDFQAFVSRPGELLLFKGDLESNKPVHHINVRGITFAETDWTLPPDGYADTQAAIGIHGAVRLDGAIDSTIENCVFKNLGSYALDFGQGCKWIKVSHNQITDIAAGGVRVGETSRPSDSSRQTDHITIEDNEMHGLGRIYPSAIGVLILQSGHNRVAHNHIHDLYYTAISVGWTWGYRETPCHDNIIEFNHLHDIGQEMLSDMGAVYTLGPQHGTVIRNNLIHDVRSFTYGGWGLYPDEGSTGILLENNLVYRTKSAGFHQHYGRENIVRNNIFAFGDEHQMMRTREEPHISFLFQTNIVYFNSGNLLGSNWKNEQFVVEHNIYFDARPGKKAQDLRFAGETFEQWRARGHDTNSLIADPLFADASKFDFRLKSNSPALALGFKAIDLSSIGPRKRTPP